MCLKNLNMHPIPQKEITKRKLQSLQISLYKSLRLVSIPTNEILLMEEILHQLRLVVYPFIPLFTGFCTFQVVVWDFFHHVLAPKPTHSLQRFKPPGSPSPRSTSKRWFPNTLRTTCSQPFQIFKKCREKKDMPQKKKKTIKTCCCWGVKHGSWWGCFMKNTAVFCFKKQNPKCGSPHFVVCLTAKLGT